jgi:protocatechuate 3,4-dioxygenase beta subunit
MAQSRERLAPGAHPFDPILQSIPDRRGRDLLVAALDLELTEPEWALGYRWDITLRGRNATPREH